LVALFAAGLLHGLVEGVVGGSEGEGRVGAVGLLVAGSGLLELGEEGKVVVEGGGELGGEEGEEAVGEGEGLDVVGTVFLDEVVLVGLIVLAAAHKEYFLVFLKESEIDISLAAAQQVLHS
jgi:hypothetical protein